MLKSKVHKNQLKIQLTGLKPKAKRIVNFEINITV